MKIWDGILKKGFIRRESSQDNTMQFHIVLFLQRPEFGIFFFFPLRFTF